MILGYQKNDSQILYSVAFGFAAYLATQIVVGGLGGLLSIISEEQKILMFGVILLYSLVIAIVYVIARKELNRGVNIE